MKRYFYDYINDILSECKYLIERSSKITFEEFEKNEDLRRAFIRSLEVIGEATKKIPTEIKHKNPRIPWKEMAGMRDKLIHDYFGVDYDIIWQTVIEDIPLLKVEIENLLEYIDEE